MTAIAGGLFAAPLAAEAQQKAMPVIGVLNTGSPSPSSAPFMDAFRQGLSEVQIDEARAVGEDVWVYSTGEVSGRVRGLGMWMPIYSWKREPEVARRERGVWRLYGDQK